MIHQREDKQNNTTSVKQFRKLRKHEWLSLQKGQSQLIVKHGITTEDLKQEYADRYYSEYLTEATEAQLIDYILNGFNEE